MNRLELPLHYLAALIRNINRLHKLQDKTREAWSFDSNKTVLEATAVSHPTLRWLLVMSSWRLYPEGLQTEFSEAALFSDTLTDMTVLFCWSDVGQMVTRCWEIQPPRSASSDRPWKINVFWDLLPVNNISSKFLWPRSVQGIFGALIFFPFMRKQSGEKTSNAVL